MTRCGRCCGSGGDGVEHDRRDVARARLVGPTRWAGALLVVAAVAGCGAQRSALPDWGTVSETVFPGLTRAECVSDVTAEVRCFEIGTDESTADVLGRVTDVLRSEGVTFDDQPECVTVSARVACSTHGNLRDGQVSVAVIPFRTGGGAQVEVARMISPSELTTQP